MTAILGWGKPLGYEPQPFHAIVSTDNRGAVVTLCRGAWSKQDPWEMITAFFGPQHLRFNLIEKLAKACLACVRERFLLACARPAIQPLHAAAFCFRCGAFHTTSVCPIPGAIR